MDKIAFFKDSITFQDIFDGTQSWAKIEMILIDSRFDTDTGSVNITVVFQPKFDIKLVEMSSDRLYANGYNQIRITDWFVSYDRDSPKVFNSVRCKGISGQRLVLSLQNLWHILYFSYPSLLDKLSESMYSEKDKSEIQKIKNAKNTQEKDKLCKSMDKETVRRVYRKCLELAGDKLRKDGIIALTSDRDSGVELSDYGFRTLDEIKEKMVYKPKRMDWNGWFIAYEDKTIKN